MPLAGIQPVFDCAVIQWQSHHLKLVLCLVDQVTHCDQQLQTAVLHQPEQDILF